jgi:hypothetical protein
LDLQQNIKKPGEGKRRASRINKVKIKNSKVIVNKQPKNLLTNLKMGENYRSFDLSMSSQLIIIKNNKIRAIKRKISRGRVRK